MSPTKQEEYDASNDAFDTKRVYVAIEEVERYQQEFSGYIAALKKAAYDAARALEAEREKVKQLETQAQVEDDAHEADCTCNDCSNDGFSEGGGR